MRTNYYLIYGILVCLYLFFSGYMGCSSFQPRDCNLLGLDYNCTDAGHNSYPSRENYRQGSGSSGNNWGNWYHK